MLISNRRANRSTPPHSRKAGLNNVRRFFLIKFGKPPKMMLEPDKSPLTGKHGRGFWSIKNPTRHLNNSKPPNRLSPSDHPNAFDKWSIHQCTPVCGSLLNTKQPQRFDVAFGFWTMGEWSWSLLLNKMQIQRNKREETVFGVTAAQIGGWLQIGKNPLCESRFRPFGKQTNMFNTVWI